MKKILLATSALAAIASFGASAHVRDGLVETSKNRVELAITGEISVFTGFTSFELQDYKLDAEGRVVKGNYFRISSMPNLPEFFHPEDVTDPPVEYGTNNLDYSTWGQNYTADINFVATTHVRDWEITGVIELDVDPSAAPKYKTVLTPVLDANGVQVVNSETGELAFTYETIADPYYPYPSDKGFLSAGEVYVDFAAPYGTFRVGKGSGPSDELSLEAEIPGYDLEDITGNDDFRLTGARFADSFNQIGYYSPVWNGFQFGIAYGFMENTIAGVDSNDLVELAAVYKGEYNAFSYGVSAAYRLHLDDEISSWDDEMTAGLSLGYMGFNWTTTYGTKTKEISEKYDHTRNGIRTALTYDWDRWSFGAYYEMAEEVTEGYRYDQAHSADLYGVGAEFDVFDGLVWKFGANFLDFEKTYEANFKDGVSYTYRDGSAFQVLTGFDLEW